MPIVEKSGLMKYKDAAGNTTIMYPITNTDNVDGLEEWNKAMLLKNATVALPASSMWRSVCYGDGKFVAVAYNSAIAAYSTEGSTWTQTTLPASKRWYSVCYGNGKFVAVASGSNIAAYSTDGINWVNTAYKVINPAGTDATTNLNKALGAVTMAEVNAAIQSAIQITWGASY